MTRERNSSTASDRTRSAEREDLTNQTINGYRVLHQLGSGGMADVYLAFHETLQRHVALKVMRTDLAASKDHLQRFLQEARSAASLIHPNIVQVYDIGNWGKIHYIAQEYIAGNTLRAFVHRRGSLPQPETMSIMLQIAAALQKAASIGIVHRDIKPDNILLTPDGEVKVADFGLARVRSQSNGLTEIGVALGTPTYMSPEQIQGQSVDARSDLYSLGTTAYEMLAGRPPFEGETALALALQHVQTNPPDLQAMRPDIDIELIQIVMRLLSKNPDDRFGSAADLTRSLKKIAERLSLTMSVDNPIPLSGIFLTDAPVIGPHTTHLQTAMFREAKPNSRLRFRWLTPVASFVGVGVLSTVVVSNLRREALIEKPIASNVDSVKREMSVEKQFFVALVNNRAAEWRAIEAQFPPTDPANVSYNIKAWLHLAWLDLEHKNLTEAHQAAEKMLQPEYALTRDKATETLAIIVQSMVDLYTGRQNASDEKMRAAKQIYESLSPEGKSVVERAMPSFVLDQWILPISDDS
ncbi:MAG: serine/threonine-protein kinase [Pirellulaceae bacterium]|nr:serine/threonine-protein kinase [Pirellulaceae bacterium]